MLGTGLGRPLARGEGYPSRCRHPQILPASPMKRSETAGFHPRHLVSQAGTENEIGWKSQAEEGRPGHWPARQAEKASGKRFVRRLLGQLNNKEEDWFHVPFSELCCIKTPQGFIPRCPPHDRANSETCGMAGPFRRQDRCHSEPPPRPSRSPQCPSHPQLEKGDTKIQIHGMVVV